MILQLRRRKEKIQRNSQRVQCYECQGLGNFAQECPNHLRKKKAFTITWDDESKSDKNGSDNEAQGEKGHEQFLAFMVVSRAEGRM